MHATVVDDAASVDEHRRCVVGYGGERVSAFAKRKQRAGPRGAEHVRRRAAPDLAHAVGRGLWVERGDHARRAPRRVGEIFGPKALRKGVDAARRAQQNDEERHANARVGERSMHRGDHILRRVSAPRLVLIVSLASYLLLSLERFPPVSQDEPWIAAAPYKLATEGVYGSDLFAGYYGMDRHNYEHMPVFPLMEAGVFRLSGVSRSEDGTRRSVVVPMRLLSVACGFALLLCVFAVASQVGGEWAGALSVVLMTLLRVSSSTSSGSGILLLDSARINRYDIAAPVFALIALWSLIGAERGEAHQGRGRNWKYGVAGAFV